MIYKLSMCDFCVKHGGGGKWYENVENYARKLYRLRKEELNDGTVQDIQAMADSIIDEAMEARALNKPDYEDIIKRVEQMCHNIHFGQVVTLEEIEKIADIAYPIARMTCVCRRNGRGAKDEENYLCVGIGVGMYKWERWPENYRGGIEFMSPKEAKEWLRNVNEVGLFIHSGLLGHHT